jgi:hypothetical protein
LQLRNLMLTVKECKEILENEAEGLTDEEIIQIREWITIMADIAIDSMENTNTIKVKNY